MFDIGFWEIVLIGIVALLVVGPDEFPTLLRNAGRSIGKVRRFLSSVKSDLDFEIDKANEIKRLMTKEAELSELHNMLGKTSSSVPEQSTSASNKVENNNGIATTPTTERAEADSMAPKPVANRGPDQRSE